MKSWLSQKSHSWSMVPSAFQWPIVAMPIAKRLPVGAIDLPSGVGRVAQRMPIQAGAMDVPRPAP
jgi:hypothetical protein